MALPQGEHHGALGVIDRPGPTLTSPGPGAVMRADGQRVDGKAILVVRAPGVRIHNIEFRDARVPTGNGAGICFKTGTLALYRCRFFDNQMGVLTASQPEMQLSVHDRNFGDAPATTAARCTTCSTRERSACASSPTAASSMAGRVTC